MTLQRWKCQVCSRVPSCPGIAVKTTLDAAQTVQYTALISGITKQVRASDSTIDVFIALYFLCVPSCQARAMVRNIDPGNDLTFLRLRCRLFSKLSSEHCLKWFVSRSKKNEILIAPGWCCEIVWCWCWQYICRPGLYPDRGAAGRRPSAQHRRAGQGGVNSALNK